MAGDLLLVGIGIGVGDGFAQVDADACFRSMAFLPNGFVPHIVLQCFVKAQGELHRGPGRSESDEEAVAREIAFDRFRKFGQQLTEENVVRLEHALGVSDIAE